MSADNMQQEETKTWTEELSVAGSELKATIERLAKDVTVHRIVVRSPNGDKMFEVPALAGVAATLLLGPYILIALGISMIAQFKIEVVRHEVAEPVVDEDIEISVEEVDVDSAETPSPSTPPTAEDVEIPIEEPEQAPESEPEIEIPVEEPELAPEVQTPIEEIAVDSAESTPPPEKPAPAASDDLKKIHGVGPANAKALIAAGFITYADIAAAEPEALKSALKAANIARLANYETWPSQAAFAAANDWDGFAEYCEALKAKK